LKSTARSLARTSLTIRLPVWAGQGSYSELLTLIALKVSTHKWSVDGNWRFASQLSGQLTTVRWATGGCLFFSLLIDKGNLLALGGQAVIGTSNQAVV